MSRRKNDPNHPFVAKPEPQNRSKITVETPGVRDEPAEKEEQDRELADVNRKAEIIRRGGTYSDRIKREPGAQLDRKMHEKQPIERA